MENKATSLQAKILAVNTNNSHSELIINFELSQLSKHIGQNILKIDGSFKAKINHTKHEDIKGNFEKYGFNWHFNTQYYFTSNYNRLSVSIKTCVSGGGSDRCGVSNYCIYETNSIDLFLIDESGNLQPLEKQYFENRQFDEFEILEAQKKIKAAAEEYNKILNLMPYEFRSVTGCERLTR